MTEVPQAPQHKVAVPVKFGMTQRAERLPWQEARFLTGAVLIGLK